MKRQTTKREKIPANYISHKGLIFKIYKELIQLNGKKYPDFKKWAEIGRDIFPKNTRCYLTTVKWLFLKNG